MRLGEVKLLISRAGLAPEVKCSEAIIVSSP